LHSLFVLLIRSVSGVGLGRQVYVVVEVEEMTATHQTFRFKVYDSGIGISTEGQKKLFNRFSQVGSGEKLWVGGWGEGGGGQRERERRKEHIRAFAECR
jgi:signal transduction histidine kinase